MESNFFVTKYELEKRGPTSHLLIYANMLKPNPRNYWWCKFKDVIFSAYSDEKFNFLGIILGSIGATSDGTSTSARSSGEIDLGTYEVKDNTIMLTENDGSTRSLLFFIYDGDVHEIH